MGLKMDNSIFTRSLPIYTYLDKVKDTKEAQQLFLAECESRKKANDLIQTFDINYIDDEINFLFNLVDKEIQTKEIEQIITIIENKYKNKIENNTIERFEDKYFLLLLAGFSYRSMDEQYNHTQDIIDFSFYIDIKDELYSLFKDKGTLDFIYNDIKNKHKIDYGLFYFMIKTSKFFTQKVDEFITNKKINYISYRLIHTTQYKNYQEAPYVQIDLTLSQDEIMKQILLIKNKYKNDISKYQALNKKVQLISKGTEYANMLYTYDCRKIKKSVLDISIDIRDYCLKFDINFNVSKEKYEHYLKTAKQYIN
jgi:hypothetical protein